MATPTPAVELLVHIAASSRAADDAAYRRLARAYLDFRPARRTPLALLTGTQEHEVAGRDGIHLDDVTDAETALPEQHLPSGHPFAATAPLGSALALTSQDLSFRSALDNRSSPRLLRSAWQTFAQADFSPPQQSASKKTSSFRAPPSQLSDSYPLPDTSLLQDTPTRILERYLDKDEDDCFFLPSCRSPQRAVLTQEQPDEEAIDVPSSLPVSSSHGHDASHRSARFDSQEIIPTTPLVPQARMRNRRSPSEDLSGHQGLSVNDITHVSSSFRSHASTVSSPRAASEPLPREDEQRAEVPSKTTAHAYSDSGDSQQADCPTADQLLEIRAPSPEVGDAILNVASLVPEPLAHLAQSLSSRYHPKATRVLDPLERGYWHLECKRWTEEQRVYTWGFLANYLASGCAGWGIWCRRDAANEWIRLFCWAHLAEHAYLLLYVASGRAVMTTGTRWIDADGMIALEVAAAQRRA